MEGSSFQKISKHSVHQIRGTKPSFQNSQLLTSTGVQSLDYFLGGGLPVGTLLLIEENQGGAYAELLLKYFIAEGAACNHALHIAGTEKPTEQIIKTLPGLLKEEENNERIDNAQPMKIAWRYRDLPSNKTAIQTGLNSVHKFNLSQKMDPELLKKCSLNSQDLLNTGRCSRSLSLETEQHQQQFPIRTLKPYETLLKSLASEMKQFSTEEPPRNLLRIAISKLGSPSCWNKTTDPVISLLRCLHALRCLLRSAYAVCVVTIPAQLYLDLGAIHKIRRLCDYVIECEPFTNSEDHYNPAFRDYHGLFHIHQRSRINTVAPILPDTSDLMFSSKRKSFTIEKMHLPPDLGDFYGGPISTTNDDSNIYKPKLNLCGATGVGANKFDF